MPRTPIPRLWQADKVSHQYVADYKPFSFVDGEGVRCSLYVSGCLFKCEGCFNEDCLELSPRAALHRRARRPHDGGPRARVGAGPVDPGWGAFPEHPGVPRGGASPARRVRRHQGRVVLERLHVRGTRWRIPTTNSRCWSEVDVLCDGRFEEDQKDLTLPFRGSRNQRVLDARQSLAQGRAVWWETAGVAEVIATGPMPVRPRRARA